MRPELSSWIVVLAGIVLLLASPALGWYQFRFDGTTASTATAPGAAFYGQYVFFPGSEFRTYAACSGDPSFCQRFDPTAFSGTHPYATPGPGFTAYPNVGRLYEAVLGLLVAAGGLAAAGLGLAGWSLRAGRSASRTAVLAVGISMALAFTAPALIAVGTPGAASADYHTPPNSEGANFTGPGGSFTGSCSAASCGSGGGVADSWGPLVGWYVAWLAASLLALGWIDLARRGWVDRSVPPPMGPSRG